jgi:GNAT superfamily N-acetyltransferase
MFRGLSMSDITLRAARLADAERIAALTTQLGYQIDAATVRVRLGRILQRPDQVFVVAAIADEAVGWLHLVLREYLEVEPYVMVAGLVVDEAHRRRGIGRLLMDRADRWGREQNCSFIRWWSSSTRVEAHRFYESLGYAKVKTQFSFAKSIDPARQDDLRAFVPRLPSSF